MLTFLFFIITVSVNAEVFAELPSNYESLDACSKQKFLWDRAKASQYDKLPKYSRLGVIELLKMSLQELLIKGSRFSDISPRKWKKYLHRRGALAKVEIVPRGAHSYTGVFQGAKCGLLRLSLTYDPKPKRKAVAPGLALKILRDGMYSANVSALYSLNGQKNEYNFFAHAMSNIVPKESGIGTKLVHRIFSKVTDYPEELRLGDLGLFTAKGEPELSANAPRQVFFVPGEGLKFDSSKHEIREDFLSIAAGTLIYSIYAVTDEFKNFDYSEYNAEKRSEMLKSSKHIADIVTTSAFTVSRFGDDGIFFRHQLHPKTKK